MIDGVERDLAYCKQLIYDKIVNVILPDKEQQEYFLMCVARALAGHYGDKKWYVAQGARDCGKGVLCLLLEKAFQKFVGLFKSDNFLCSRIRITGDEAKKLSWLIPLEFCRIALSSEISSGKGVKINGDMIKGFSSGGDTQQARQNRKDEIDFRMQCMMFMFCNELPDVDPIDTLETLENFIFKSKFVSQQDLDEVKNLNDDNLGFFKLRDNNIKEWCCNDYVLDAFTSIIFDHYVEVRPTMPQVMINDNSVVKGDNTKSLEVACTKIFKKTPNKNDAMSTESVLEIVRTYCKNEDISEKKVKTTLTALGLGVYDRYRINGLQVRGYGYIKVRDEAKAVLEENSSDDE
jgi:hypothetical protein